MPLLRSGTLESTWVLSSEPRRKGGGRGRQVIPVGGRFSVPVIPNGLVSNAAEEFLFIESVTASPIQNMKNFSNRLRRLEVRRACWGADAIEVLSMGEEVRTRMQLSVRFLTFDRTIKAADYSLLPTDAFSCFGIDRTPRTFTLPSANRESLGLCYFFAKPLSAGDVPMRIRTGRAADKIQIRIKPFREQEAVVQVDRISGASTSASRATLALVCRERGLWVAENIATDNATPPTPLWAPF
jgi:hypothetical protein